MLSNPSLSLSFTPKHAHIGQQADIDETLVCATLQAAPSSTRAPIDLVVALDISGSMNGSKLQLCQATLRLLLPLLQTTDRFGLVSYSQLACLEIPLGFCTEVHVQKCLETVNQLRSLGSTNISAALGLAAHELRQDVQEGRVRSLFLLTDGLANHGIHKTPQLLQFAAEILSGVDQVHDVVSSHPSGGFLGGGPIRISANKAMPQSLGNKIGFVSNMLGTSNHVPAASDSATIQVEPFPLDTAPPIVLNTFGYGVNHDEGLLGEMATGGYYFVENDEHVATAFGDALGGILSVVAQKCSLTIRGATRLEYTKDTAAQPDGSFVVPLCDLFAEESRDVLFHVALPKGTTPKFEASIDYYDVLNNQQMQSTVQGTLERSEGSDIAPPNSHVTAQALRIQAARQMAKARELATQGKLLQAQQCLRDLHFDKEDMDDPMIGMIRHDVQQATVNLMSGDRKNECKRMEKAARGYAQQRSAESSMDVISAFQNSSQKMWMSKMSSK